MNINHLYIFLSISGLFIIQVIFGNLYINNKYIETTGTITEVDANKNQCSVIGNCKDRDYFGESCLNKTINMEPGKCDNGYKCLKKINVGGSGGGSTEICGKHIHHQLCFVNVYDCYDLNAKLEYGTKDNNKYYWTIRETCNNLRNNTQCINNFKNDNIVGSSIQLYYDKDKPKKVYTKITIQYILYPLILLVDIIVVVIIAKVNKFI